MPAPKSKKKVLKYSHREKLTAVRLSEAPGARVKDVAAALDIHPFMLSRWRREARAALGTRLPFTIDYERANA
jgi:transposase-like protein